MKPDRLPAPPLLYAFLAFGLTAWLIAFLDALAEDAPGPDTFIRLGLLALVGVSLLSLPLRLTHVALLTLFVWCGFGWIWSVMFAGSAMFSSDLSDSARIYRLIFAASQLAASWFFFRRSLFLWLFSGGYVDIRRKPSDGDDGGEPADGNSAASRKDES